MSRSEGTGMSCLCLGRRGQVCHVFVEVGGDRYVMSLSRSEGTGMSCLCLGRRGQVCHVFVLC